MISSATIQAALFANLADSGLFERVITALDADLESALDNLRDSPVSLAVITPGADTITHDLMDGTNQPLVSKIRSRCEIIIATRRLDMAPTGDPAILTLKDSVLARLLWDSLGVPGLLCLPAFCEPIVLQFADGTGREAWKLTLDLRQLITG